MKSDKFVPQIESINKSFNKEKKLCRTSTKFLDTKSNYSQRSGSSKHGSISNISRRSARVEKKKKVKMISSKFVNLLSGADN